MPFESKTYLTSKFLHWTSFRIYADIGPDYIQSQKLKFPSGLKVASTKWNEREILWTHITKDHKHMSIIPGTDIIAMCSLQWNWNWCGNYAVQPKGFGEVAIDTVDRKFRCLTIWKPHTGNTADTGKQPQDSEPNLQLLFMRKYLQK